MKRKIIIIYEKAGGGHKQVALILKEILASENLEIEIMTPLELISYPFDNFFTTILVNKFRLLYIQFLSDFVFCFLCLSGVCCLCHFNTKNIFIILSKRFTFKLSSHDLLYLYRWFFGY